MRTRRTPKDQDGYQGHFDFSCFLEIIPHYRNCEAAVVRAEGEAILEDIPKLWREVAKRAARTCLDADDWLD